MRIHIDVSILYGARGEEQCAYGNLKGHIDVAVIPSIGDQVAFMFSSSGTPFVSVNGFNGSIRVVDRIIVANSSDSMITVALDEIVVESASDASKVGSYLSTAFGLFLDIY